MKRKYLILFSLMGLILSLDQWTKHLVQGGVAPGSRTPLLPGLLSLVHVHNSGVAFGFLRRVPIPFEDVFFVGIPVFALVLILLIFIKLQDNQVPTSVALTTILGGAMGNLIDRIRQGYVTDFLDLHFGEAFHFPPFNVADCSIIMGVVIMFIVTLIHQRSGQVPTPQEG